MTHPAPRPGCPGPLRATALLLSVWAAIGLASMGGSEGAEAFTDPPMRMLGRRIAVVLSVADPVLAPTRSLCLDSMRRLRASLPSMIPAREH